MQNPHLLSYALKSTKRLARERFAVEADALHRCRVQRSEHDEKAVLMEVKQRNEDLLLLEKAVSTLNSLHEHLNFLVHADVRSSSYNFTLSVSQHT